MSAPIITIAPADDGGAAVTVRPVVPGFDFDASYPTYIGARTFARGVRRHRGFPIRDLIGDASHD